MPKQSATMNTADWGCRLSEDRYRGFLWHLAIGLGQFPTLWMIMDRVSLSYLVEVKSTELSSIGNVYTLQIVSIYGVPRWLSVIGVIFYESDEKPRETKIRSCWLPSNPDQEPCWSIEVHQKVIQWSGKSSSPIGPSDSMRLLADTGKHQTIDSLVDSYGDAPATPATAGSTGAIYTEPDWLWLGRGTENRCVLHRYLR